jgi:flagellar hook-basal body complex protein FliE
MYRENKMEINASAQSLLSQIREYQNKIEAVKTGSEITQVSPDLASVVNEVPEGSTFSSELSKVFTSAMTEVNAMQNVSVNSQTEFQMGGDIPLTEVVMNMQKASLAMEATIQVRNKVLTAYQEIINMPV